MTSRGAGFAFPICVLVGSFYQSSLMPFAIIGLLISALGLWDDLVTLSAKKRLIAQFIAVTSLLILYLPFEKLPFIYSSFIFFFALLLILSAINFYNFADGINGHIAFQSIVSIAAWALVAIKIEQSFQLFSLLAIFVSLLAFLWANVIARWVFMGDTGSTFLGYFITAFPVTLISQISLDSITELKPILIVLLLPSIIFLDCIIVLLAKAKYRMRFSQAHRAHFYQQLSRRAGWTHLKAAGFLVLWQALISAFALLAIFSSSSWAFASLLLLLVYIIAISRPNFREILATKKMLEASHSSSELTN